MPDKFYIGNYGGPLTVDVFASDGTTPFLPLSATIDIFNLADGSAVVTNEPCTVASGSATYVIPEGSPATATAGRYVGYMDVLLEVGNKKTEEVYFNVYEKASSLILEQWRMQVEMANPGPEFIDDDAARDWIDAAVGWLNGKYASGYSSTLAVITPTPTDYDTHFIVYVAGLLARRAWWTGKGSYRDDEISYDARSIQAEFAALDKYFVDLETSGIYDILPDTQSVTNRNRDGVFYRGRWFEDILPISNPYYDSWTGV